MADPRFYDNRGPFTLRQLCAKTQLLCPEDARAQIPIEDVAGLAQAGALHLTYWDGARARGPVPQTKAGWCLAGETAELGTAAESTLFVRCRSVGRAFAAIAARFYPEHEIDIGAQGTLVHPSARLGTGIVLAPGVVIGPGAEIGERTRIGAYAVIGRGVAIGRSCEIGAHASVAFSYAGDEVVIQAGAVVGGSGFSFASGADGHVKFPQLGRVIIQDRVEIGANSTIDRGALGDTVVGEGSKIDNLVQIGHNTTMGRHCIMVGQSGLAGSVVLGDFVIVGGMAGIADHLTVGDGARIAGGSGVTRSLAAGRDYGGYPAREIKAWHREMAILARQAKRDKAADE